MNILFLTIGRIDSIEAHGIYPDILRQIRDKGHSVYIVSQRERRLDLQTELRKENGSHMLFVRTGNITKSNLIEKGISTLLIEGQYFRAIKQYFHNVRFDLIIYSTPPITLAGVVKKIKKRDGAKSYLLLKDIFPQNAVDLGMMSQSGVKGLLYKYFRKKEKELYFLSDRIGCMSQANIDYILNHNPEISKEKVEVCPNCIEVQDIRLRDEERLLMRSKYNLPHDKRIFVYGGNLGRPQDVSFIVNCLKRCAKVPNVYFVIAGSGTDRHLIETYVKEENPSHVKLFGQLAKDEYDKMIACCDVGLIFLDHRFTIPNFPSRLLSYMQAGLPVLACTDPNTDIGDVITEGEFGSWCESDDVEKFAQHVHEKLSKDLSVVSRNSYMFLKENYDAEKVYRKILDFADS